MTTLSETIKDDGSFESEDLSRWFILYKKYCLIERRRPSLVFVQDTDNMYGGTNTIVGNIACNFHWTHSVSTNVTRQWLTLTDNDSNTKITMFEEMTPSGTVFTLHLPDSPIVEAMAVTVHMILV